MKPWYYFLASGVVALSLSSCGQQGKSLTPKEIDQKIQGSLVLINYQDKGGYGSGFVVDRDKGVCTVLTARHVVSESC